MKKKSKTERKSPRPNKAASGALAVGAGSATETTDSKYHVNYGKPWKPTTPRIDVQSGYCWVVNGRGHAVGSFCLSENGRARSEENRGEAEAFFRKYYPTEAKALLG